MEPANAATKNGPIIARVKAMRVETNQLIDRLRSGHTSREMSLAITNLQQARHWMGEELGRLGQELPAEFQDK